MSVSSRKKERRAKRHARNKALDATHKEQAWEAGKLIEENHNGLGYSETYTRDLSGRLCVLVMDFVWGPGFMQNFRCIKSKVRDLLVYWNPDYQNLTEWNILKGALDLYYDDPRGDGYEIYKYLHAND